MKKCPAAWRRAGAALAAILALASHGTAHAQDLVADLSNHLIAITSRFNGADVLLFGAVEGQGDIVVTVRGPGRQTMVRRKERMLGIWLNAASVSFADAPGYYAVFADKPIDELVSPTLRGLEQIGIDTLRIDPADPADAPAAAEFRAAFIARMERAGLYQAAQGHVDFLGRTLFRATLAFPASVPVGTYAVTVYLVRNHDVVAAQTTPLIVSQSGIEADIHDFAQRQGLLYGIFAVMASAMAGWLSSLFFRSG